MNDHNTQDPLDTQTESTSPAQQSSYVDDYVPPTTNDTSQVAPIYIADEPEEEKIESTQENPKLEIDSDADFESEQEEAIESQNIFMMLGVEAGDDDLKEKFLDQLQEVIWDDFLGNDVELLLSEEENTQFKVYKDKVDSAQTESQEKSKDEMVDFLEKNIPDLEDIMLEKALDLKADLFAERISGMKEYFSDKPDELSGVNKAESQMLADKWQSAAQTLNNIKE
jgi:hypothetical protein